MYRENSVSRLETVIVAIAVMLNYTKALFLKRDMRVGIESHLSILYRSAIYREVYV